MMQSRTKHGWLAILAVGLILISSSGAAAQAKVTDAYGVIFPSALELGRHQFSSPPVEVSVTENLPPEFRFKIAAPSPDWQQVGPELAAGGAQRLGGFVSPKGTSQGVIEVLAHKLQVEAAPADWLLTVMIKAGATILKTRQDQGAAGEVFEALALLPKCEDGSARLVRAAVYRSGQYMLVVRALAREDFFARLTYQFAAATLLFKPQTMAPESLVGNWAPYCLPAGLCFLGPGRGRAAVPWPGRPVQEVGYDLSLGGKITGTLHVKAVMNPELAEAACDGRIEVLKNSLTQRGVKVKWLGGGVSLNHPKLPGKICFFRGKAQGNAGDLELFVFSWKGQSVGAVVWLLTVGQVANMPAWVHNKRTFELLCQSLKTTGSR